MVSKRNFWETIKYYNILLYFITFIILSLIKDILAEYIISYLDIPARQTFLIQLAYITVYVTLYGLWFMVVFTQTRAKRYYDLVGRSFGKDKKYNRTYHELVAYFKDNDKFRMDENLLPNINWKNAEGMILGKAKNGHLFHIKSGKDGKNYFIFGLPSSGKTAGPIICSCLRWGMNHLLNPKNKKTDGSVFCIDLKNDIYKATHKFRKILRFNLMDPKHSYHYNPFAGIEKLSIDARCNFIENIGFNIIAEAKGGDGKYFTDTAYDYWNGIALYMLSQDINISFPEVIKAILAGNPIDWVKKIVASDCEEAKRRLASKWGENEKNLSGGYSNLCQNCRKFASEKLFFLLGNDPKYKYISVQSLEDGYDVYVGLDQAELKNYAALLSLIVQQTLSGFLNRETNPRAGRVGEDRHLRPILFVLDEFAQLTNLNYDAISTAFMTLRSRNISICCALQSRSSIAEMFHSENACNSLIDCVTTFCFLSVQEVATRKWASDLIGSRRVLKISNSLNDGTSGSKTSGRSVQEAREPIFFPEEFGSLKDDSKGRDEIIIYSQGKYIKADKQYYFK